MAPENKIADALQVLNELGMPRAQQNDRSALCLLALLDLRPRKSWAASTNPLVGITPMMEFAREHYGKRYAPNTRETFRRQTVHQFVAAGIALYNPDNPARPVNSPKAVYQIETNTLTLRKIPVKLATGETMHLSPGAHSELIKAIIEQFAPRFVPGCVLIYAGDTGEKWGYFDRELLEALGVRIDDHGKIPDAVLYYPKRNWLVLVESVTSHGPMDGKRHQELTRLFAGSKAGLGLRDRLSVARRDDAVSGIDRLGDGGLGCRCAIPFDPFQRGAVPWAHMHRIPNEASRWGQSQDFEINCIPPESRRLERKTAPCAPRFY